jgi:hypothetical protein
VLLHQVCGNCQPSCDGDGQSFWNKSNGDADAVDDESRDVDEVRMLGSEIGAPVS